MWLVGRLWMFLSKVLNKRSRKDLVAQQDKVLNNIRVICDGYGILDKIKYSHQAEKIRVHQ